MKNAIDTADNDGDWLTFIRAADCYGDLLLELERGGEAVSWLKLALDRYAFLRPDTDILDLEVSRARELLDRIEEK